MDVSYDVTATLRAQDHGHTPVVLVYDARGNGGGTVCPTITGDHQNWITDYTAIVVYTMQNEDMGMNASETCAAQYKDSGEQGGVTCR